jgi:hypothetical protein
VRRRYLDTLLAEAERLGDRQLAHYAPVVAAVEGELAAQMGQVGKSGP